MKQERESEIGMINVPKEIIELPSGGYLYPEDSPLRSGKIELKYPTAVDEDILTSKNLLQKGLTIERFLEAIILTKGVRLDDLLIGDENAIMYAARILAYGPDYEIEYTCGNCNNKAHTVVDLNSLSNVEINEELFKNGNKFDFTLPKSGKVVTFKLLTHKDERDIQQTAKNMSKYNKKSDHIGITRLKKSIIAIDGNEDRIMIDKEVESMLSMDSIKLKKYISDISPDVITKFNYECEECGYVREVPIPLGITFFWPNSEL